MSAHHTARWAGLLAVLLAAPLYAAGPPAVPAPGLPVPTVSIRVRVPAEVAPGQELKYVLIASNDSDAPAHHVTVRVPLPATASFLRADPEPTEKGKALIWKFGTLKPCTRKTITLVLAPAGKDDVQLCGYVQFEHGQCVRTRVRDKPKGAPPGAASALELRKTGPAEVAPYDAISYKLEVRNRGKTALRDVVVEDKLPSGLVTVGESKPPAKGDSTLTWELGELAPGKSRVIEYQAAALRAGVVENKAVATAAGGLRREASFKTRVRLPRLEVRLSWPAVRAVGRSVTYRITVRNPDTLTAKGVQISDDLVRDKDDIEFVSATAGGTATGRTVEWDLGDLEPGKSKSVEVAVKAKRAGTFKNVCTVSETRGVKEQAVVVTDFVEADTLLLEADGDRPALAIGQQATLTLRAVNAGKAAQKNVRLTITLPEGLRAVEVKGAVGAKIAGRTVTLPALAEIKAGDQKGVTLIVQGARAGDQRLRVGLSSASTAKDKPLQGELTFTVTAAK